MTEKRAKKAAEDAKENRANELLRRKAGQVIRADPGPRQVIREVPSHLLIVILCRIKQRPKKHSS